MDRSKGSIRLSRFEAKLYFCSVAFVIAVAYITVQPATAAITFTPDHIYTSNYFSRTISEYNSQGSFLGSLTLPISVAEEVRGLAFGPDGLLYATVERDSDAAVLALWSDGSIQQTYPFESFGGNISNGKLAVSSSSIYVCGDHKLTKFQIGSPNSGTTIFSKNKIIDVEIMPGGNLLVASGYELQEVTNTGSLVREIDGPFSNIRGVEYNPTTGKMFVTHGGHSDFYHRLMRFDFPTGTMESNITFTYADDLFLATSGELLVGSRTEVPRFYSQDLVQGGQIGTNQQMFITQLVPEPGTIAMLAAGVPAYALWLRASKARQKFHTRC